MPISIQILFSISLSPSLSFAEGSLAENSPLSGPSQEEEEIEFSAIL